MIESAERARCYERKRDHGTVPQPRAEITGVQNALAAGTPTARSVGPPQRCASTYVVRAMNVFWLFFGVLFLTMQSLAHCTRGDFAASHTTAPPQYFNLQWVITNIYSLAIGVVLAVAQDGLELRRERQQAVMMVYSILTSCSPAARWRRSTRG